MSDTVPRPDARVTLAVAQVGLANTETRITLAVLSVAATLVSSFLIIAIKYVRRHTNPHHACTTYCVYVTAATTEAVGHASWNDDCVVVCQGHRFAYAGGYSLRQ